MSTLRAGATLFGLLAAFAPIVAAAQPAELQIRADKGGYLLGESATITVTNLTECAGETVSIGFRGGFGNRYGEVPTQLDMTGSGSATFALMRQELAVSPAVWGDCVDRGLEPGLALDPHIMLISLSPASIDQLLESLPTGAHAIAADLVGSRLEDLLSNLRPGTVTKTAYPGDGGPIASDVAAGELRAALSGGSGSDEFGSGQLGFLGTWEINGNHAILASVIRGGARHVVALGISEESGVWVISSYGSVVMQTGILETYAIQHSVLLGNIGPLAPSVGNSPARAPSPHSADIPPALSIAALAVAVAAAWLIRRPSRQ